MAVPVAVWMGEQAVMSECEDEDSTTDPSGRLEVLGLEVLGLNRQLHAEAMEAARCMPWSVPGWSCGYRSCKVRSAKVFIQATDEGTWLRGSICVPCLRESAVRFLSQHGATRASSGVE